MKKNVKTASKIAGFLIVAIIFFFLGKQLYQNWQQLSAYQWQINRYLLAGSFGVLLFSYGLSALGFKLSLGFLGKKITWKDSYTVTYLSELAKYIPGKVWSIGGVIYFSEKIGIPKSKSFLAKILLMSAGIVASLIIFLIIYPFLPGIPSSLLMKILPLLFVIPIGLVLVHPKIFKKIMKFFLAKIGKDEIDLDFKYVSIWWLILFSFPFWITHGFWFFTLVKAVYPIPISEFPVLVGIFAISWLLGFLCFFVPGGLGVREGSLVMLLKLIMPLHMAIVVSLFSRVVTIVGDLTAAGIALGLEKWERKK